MQCPKCQHENREGAKFCLKCGAKLEDACPQCGAKLPPGANFCDECGAKIAGPLESPTETKVPRLEDMRDRLYIPEPLRKRMDSAMQEMEGENRLITALFADISGFTAMSQELSPEDTVEKVNRCFQAITDAIYRYEGNINRFIGDCVLAFFGAPIAHEDDPERAIMSGLDMLDAVSKLGLNIKVGINTGMMYFGPVGTQEHREISAYGEDINLAKRLQEEAQPGQVIVGERTYRFTRKAFEFEPLHQLTLRGVKTPIRAYSAIKQLPKPEKIRGIEGLRARMIGRDDELARLKDMLDEVMHGRGQMVSIIGEAGVGKSRLVQELREYLNSKCDKVTGRQGDEENISLSPPPLVPVSLLEGRCLSLGVTASYWPFIDIFREYFGWGTDDSDRSRGDSIVSRLREMVSQGDLTEDRYDEIGPMLGNLLSVQFGTDWDDRLKNADPQQIRHRTFMAVRDFFMALSKQHPLILVFEDLHWSDSLSLDLISLLMEALTLAPLFLICVYRPEKEHKSWHLGTIASQKCSERYGEIHLRELTHQQSRRLVESLLRIDNLPSSVKEMILRKSQGNPFFVEEVIRSLIEMDMVYQEGDRWHAREGIESIAVPETIQSVILSRVDRLEDELRHVLQSASVIGRLFRRSLLERVTEQEAELESDLWDLEEHELIYQERIVPEEEYSFKHAFTQETVYESILSRRRAEIHQEIAEAMELLYGDNLDEYCEQLAYHYSRSRDTDKAILYLLKAGEKARRNYLNDQAINYFQQALELIDDSPQDESQRDCRFKALRGLGQVYFGIGNVAEAEGYFWQAVALGKEIGIAPHELVRLHYWLGTLMFWQSRWDERIRIGEEGLDLLGDDTECVEAALMNTIVGWAHYFKGDYEKAREYTILRNARFVDRLPYSEELSMAYIHLVVAYVDLEKNAEEAMRWVQALEQLALQKHDLRALGSACLHTGMVISNQGDRRGAASYVQRSLELYRRIGDTKHEAQCLGNLAGCFLWLGELQESEDCALKALEFLESAGHKSYMASRYYQLGTILLCRDSAEQAVEHFRKALQLTRESGSSGEAYAVINLARAYLAQGKRQEALKSFQEALALDVNAMALSGIEESYDDPEEFHDFCRRFREENPDMVKSSTLKQWYLEPTEVLEFPRNLFHDEFSDSLHPDWVWHDQFGDCSFSVQDGLRINAANGRDLWHLNLSAPRILRKVSGDFAVQTICAPVTEDRPSIGGLLLWLGKENFLRLARGIWGEYETSFSGCLGNEDVDIGRGRLPSQRTILRLERFGNRVNALCSSDGDEWFTVGHADFPADDPVEVGLHAIGTIQRTIYCGEYKEGTAPVFRNFGIWTK